MERFQSTKTIEKHKQKSKNANTTKATTQWMKMFCQWAQNIGHSKNIEVLAPDTLDSILQHFFAEINKKDDKDYEPSSLAAMQSSFDRYLRESNYEYSILNSRFFKDSRDVLGVKLTYCVKKDWPERNRQKNKQNKHTVGRWSAR